MSKVTFKPYDQRQPLPLPSNLGELIPENHPVKIISKIIDKIDLKPLLKTYKGGGTSSYHPRMMLKVIVYAYLCNIYSSREIERQLKENINFMWLAANNKPDHNTISRFRSQRLKGSLKKIFTQIVLMLTESGVLSLKEAYIDGTKMEANANKYTFVWRKNVKRNKERIKTQLQELWEYAESVAKTELNQPRPIDFEQLDAEKIAQTIETINNALKGKEIDAKKKAKLKYAEKNYAKNYKKYEEQEKVLGDRNSYSKTDNDATFMRMKEDSLQNKQLKPGYNIQISTNNQYVLNYTVHPNPNDTRTLVPHLQDFEEHYGFLPEELTADAGYGSEENYAYLESKGIDGYVKYNYFDKEEKKGEQAYPEFHQHRLTYHAEADYYECPAGQRMEKQEVVNQSNQSGYVQELHIYEAQNCSGCPLRSSCFRGEGNKKIHVNHKLRKYRMRAKALLQSAKGRAHRRRRNTDVESVFGNIKRNKKFRRFSLRGNDKVLVEIGLILLSHNLKKYIKAS